MPTREINHWLMRLVAIIDDLNERMKNNQPQYVNLMRGFTTYKARNFVRKTFLLSRTESSASTCLLKNFGVRRTTTTMEEEDEDDDEVKMADYVVE